MNHTDSIPLLPAVSESSREQSKPSSTGATCCSSEKQAVCCAPSEKAGCCGPPASTQGTSRCGCQ
jgi:hypothetical protein